MLVYCTGQWKWSIRILNFSAEEAWKSGILMWNKIQDCIYHVHGKNKEKGCVYVFYRYPTISIVHELVHLQQVRCYHINH